MTNLHISHKNRTLIIGVAGHRNLLLTDWSVQMDANGTPAPSGYLLAFVKTRLTTIREKHPDKQLLILTGMAEGADLLVTYVAHQMGIPFVAVLADKLETFLAPFVSEPERELCRQLLRNASKTVVCQPRQEHTPYVEVGHTIARHADELIALWNGVDTGLYGGTWDVVGMGLTGDDSRGRPLKLFRRGQGHPFRLHHLLTPRQDSPHPIPRYFDLTSLQSVLPLGTPYSWNVLSRERKRPSTNWLVRFWLYLSKHREEVWKYAVPTLLFLITVGCGTAGLLDFQEKYPEHIRLHPKDLDPTYHHFNTLEAFYKALKLEAIFPPTYDLLAAHLSLSYAVGKYAGLLFFLYAFGLTIGKVLGDTHRRWRVRYLFNWFCRPFSLVLGLNERSFSTLTDLRDRRKQVVALDANHESAYSESSRHLGSIVIGDNPKSPGSLRAIGFERADEIYLLDTDDNNNVHLVQQMDRQLAENGNPARKSDWYVQVLDPDKRQFLTKFTHKQPGRHVYAFNLYETIARRLLLQYPIDRFYRNPTATSTDVFVFGFGEMGRQIALNCLKLGHFAKGKAVNLHIFSSTKTKDEAHFFKHYSFLAGKVAPFVAQSPFAAPGIGADLVDDVFGHATVTFHDLPKTDFELLNDQFVLYDSLKPGHIASAYFCLDDELHSASYLSSLLKRLNVLYNQQLTRSEPLTDIQTFCYYNFPDDKESLLVGHRFNELAPHIPVICFGDVQRECSARALRGRALDQMAQLTALYYDEVITHDAKWPLTDAPAIIQRAADAWVGKEEMDKESNRLFADHAFDKMRQIWSQLPDSTKQTTEDATLTTARELLKRATTDKAMENQLADLEHRRWCAEKLFDGWVPLETDPALIKASALKWKNDKPYKTLARSQKRHLDLVPTRLLHDIEFQKDTSMIEGIPLFVELLQQRATDIAMN